MRVRLGYACICTSISDISRNKTITVKNYNENLLDNVIKNNLENLINILRFNNKNNIHFYRISSKLIPLATYFDFDYINKYEIYFNEIKKLIKNQRVDFHLDHFTVLNSTRNEVIEKSIKEIIYHYNLLEAMGIDEKVLIIHIGSNQFGKENSIRRFINNYNKLPVYLKECLVIENDDKIFTINDCIRIKEETGIRIVFDYHHHLCNKVDIINFNKIFEGWNIPKIHFSSPRNKRDFRAHSEYINVLDFIDFLNQINIDIDIMLECKGKDNALFRLTRQLKYLTNYEFIDETTFKK